MEFQARIVFLCASALESARILLNSTSPEFPSGLANSSGELGHNLMDHCMGGGASGTIPGYEIATDLRQPAQRDLRAAVPQCDQGAPRLPPRIRLPGRRRPQRLGAGQFGAGIRGGVQGVAPGAGTVELSLLRVRRVSAQPRKLRRARPRREGQVGHSGAADPLPLAGERAGPAPGHVGHGSGDARSGGRHGHPDRSSRTTRPASPSTRWAPRAWGGTRRPRCSTPTTRRTT